MNDVSQVVISPKREEYLRKFFPSLNKDQREGWRSTLENNIRENKMPWLQDAWKKNLEILQESDQVNNDVSANKPNTLF